MGRAGGPHGQGADGRGRRLGRWLGIHLEPERRALPQVRRGHPRLAIGRFRRQQPIGPYTVDFFCLERKLVIEVDGGQHAPEVDERRTAFIERAGYRVLRFWNEEILESMDGVLRMIAEELRAGASPSRR